MHDVPTHAYAHWHMLGHRIEERMSCIWMAHRSPDESNQFRLQVRGWRRLLGEKANDHIVAQRQKWKGMQGRAQTADALAA